MITTSSSRALCRIKRKNNTDVDEVIRLLSFGNFSVINGALKATGQDKIIPNEKNIKIIIEMINQFEPKHDKGYSDVRMGLAVACAGWDKAENVLKFLEDCQNSSYNPLIKVVANSLKNKYTNIN